MIRIVVRRGGAEQDPRAELTRQLSSRHIRFDREFELQEQHVCPLDSWRSSMDVGDIVASIGTADEHDRVRSRWIDERQSDAGHHVGVRYQECWRHPGAI